MKRRALEDEDDIESDGLDSEEAVEEDFALTVVLTLRKQRARKADRSLLAFFGAWFAERGEVLVS